MKNPFLLNEYNIDEVLLNKNEWDLIKKELQKRFSIIDIKKFDFNKQGDTYIAFILSFNDNEVVFRINFRNYFFDKFSKIPDNKISKFQRILKLFNEEMSYFEESINKFDLSPELMFPTLKADFIINTVCWKYNTFNNFEFENSVISFISKLIKNRHFEDYFSFHNYVLENFTLRGV